MTGLQILRKSPIPQIIRVNNLPPYYQNFLINFQTGKKTFNEEYVKFPNDDFLFPFNYLKFSKQFNDGFYENSLWFFHNLEEVDSISDEILEGEKSNYLVIGQFHTPDKILVGINENNKDKIFIKFGDTNFDLPHIRCVDDNIYSFLNSCEVFYNLEILGNRNPSSLYRNWGEDFWRVREEEK